MGGRRSQARRYAVLALYQWQLTGQDPLEIGRHFLNDPTWVEGVAAALADPEEAPDSGAKSRQAYDLELFRQLLYGVPARRKELDARLQPVLDRPLERVDPVECAILRAGTYELLYSPSVPYRVAINEAVDLAKLLGAEQGHRYVNGVLDRVARDMRDGETDTDASTD
ncbi:transcription antitermination factor NusB [Candidatus Thiosymbion oneisti]|uniref:transcription antitermination factor NusB n=1 Tax=Candidatus Thiosymbion oneisti TaxID=589554 RepID=UPI000ABB3E4C|nr:transcription antitermination factor NusB [Candidatus Thiosymbion oneisti]